MTLSGDEVAEASVAERTANTTSISNSESFNNELRKRRGSFPQLSSEVLSAELLAPLPQSNLSRTASIDQLSKDDDENTPLIKKVRFCLLKYLFILYRQQPKRLLVNGLCLKEGLDIV